MGFCKYFTVRNSLNKLEIIWILHASAFGASIKDEDFDNFIKITNEELANFDFSPCYYVDLEVSAD